MINFFKKKRIPKDQTNHSNSGFNRLFNKYKKYTMTSKQRMLALYNSVHYIRDNNIIGDFVECGVWKGGSSMLMIDLIKKLALDKNAYMFDTFTGMTNPSIHDVDHKGISASTYLNQVEKYPNVAAKSLLEDVTFYFKKENLLSERCHFIKGDVLDTIPLNSPEKISILRLDTDWYKSTYHELLHLYPKLVSGGILIVDDYGHWKGAKKAVDEYFDSLSFKPFLNVIDYTGRLIIKP